jgi:anti-sigma regulatory factor (Ser/Thr protein kinase)
VTPQALVRRLRAQPDQIRVIRAEVREFAIEHGAADPDAVAQRTGDDCLEILVCDEGRGMLPRPDSPGVGLGLPLVATLAESFEVQARTGGGTQVRMAFAAA